MVLEFLQSLSEMQLVGELTVLSLLIGGIIMAGGVIIAKIAKLLFHKYYAPSLPKDTAQNISKLIYFGILVISFLGFTSSQGIDLSGIMVAGGIFAVVIGFATQSVVSNLISGLFLIFYSMFRFFVEFFRVPDEQIGYLILNLTMGQIISLVFTATGIILFYLKNENK